MKINLLIIIVAVLLSACNKAEDPVVEEAPLPVGQWNIVSVDSGYIPVYPNASFIFSESLNLTGQIEFKKNGSGSLTGEAERISCTFNDFTWVRNDSLNLLFLIYRDCFLCKVNIQKMQNDTLILVYQDWCRGGNMHQGATIDYRITAIK